jgi:hypothetical protein
MRKSSSGIGERNNHESSERHFVLAGDKDRHFARRFLGSAVWPSKNSTMKMTMFEWSEAVAWDKYRGIFIF